MATLASIVTGNFLTAGTWGVCDATSESDSQAANTVLTTSYVASTAFTPGAITVDAIGVKVALRVGTTGTMTVCIGIAGVAVAGTEVTINTSDLVAGDLAANNGVGWYFFKFGTPVLLVGATLYTVMAKTSSSTMVNLYSTATSNWSRQLRTTTTAAPGAGDKLLVQGDWTAAATSSSYTVTVNETATTDYGAISISDKGTLLAGVVAATNYNLKTSGIMRVYGGGTLSLGTTGAKMPSDSSFKLNFDCVSNVDFGLELQNGSTFNAQGNPLSFVRTKLAADAAASATALTTTDSTGWKNGDTVILASTTRTRTEAEQKVMGANASGTSIGTIAALTNAHGGNSTTGVQADIAVLDRNVKIFGLSASVCCYILVRTGATVDCDYLETYFIGSNTANKRGWDIQTAATGATNIQYSCTHDCTVATSAGVYINGTSGNNVVYSNNTVYNFNSIGINQVSAIGVAGTPVTISGNLVMACVGIGIDINDVGIAVTNNISTSNSTLGISVGEVNVLTGTITGNTCYSNGGVGFTLTSITGFTTGGVTGTLGTQTCWRNNGNGVSITTTVLTSDFLFDTITLFGNNSVGISIAGTTMVGPYIFKNVTSNGGSTLVQTYGIDLTPTFSDTIRIVDSSFGATTTHGTASIQASSTVLNKTTFFNCLFSDTTEFNNTANILWNYAEQWGIASMKHDQTVGDNRLYTKYGIKRTDTVIFRTASPSERMTPNLNTGTVKIATLRSGSKFVAVDSGSTVTPSVYVRESVVGDGTDYNGMRPRLIVRANPAIGIAVDTVLATATVASEGAFELLTGTTASVTADGVLELYVDCDGTTGWVNIDDWSAV